MSRYYDDSFLAHHGILGQRWGKLNGPPYPLDASDHTQRQKTLASKAGIKVGKDSGLGERGGAEKLEKKQYFDSTGKKISKFQGKKLEKYKAKGMTQEQAEAEYRKRKAIAIGIGVTAGLVGAYAAYRIHANKVMGSGKIDPATGLRLKDHETSIEDDIKEVNHGTLRAQNPFTSLVQKVQGVGDIAKGIATGDTDINDENSSLKKGINKLTANGYANNCYVCTTDYELRRRGYDVSAKRAWGKTFSSADEIFENPEHHYDNYYNVKGDSKTSVLEYLNKLRDTNRTEQGRENFIKTAESMGPGARGNLCVSWDNGLGGHSIIWENDKNGKLHLYDSQVDKEYTDLFNDPTMSHGVVRDYFRTDNLELKPNNQSTLSEWVQDRYALNNDLSEGQGAVVAVLGASGAGAYTSYKIKGYEDENAENAKIAARRRRSNSNGKQRIS